MRSHCIYKINFRCEVWFFECMENEDIIDTEKDDAVTRLTTIVVETQ